MIRGCDMFCEAGGSGAGARAAGVEMVAGIDMCATASGTFAANFPDALAVTSRLEDVSPGPLKKGQATSTSCSHRRNAPATPVPRRA